MKWHGWILTIALFCSTGVMAADNDFSQLVNGTTPKPLKEKSVYDMPWITWGGDVVLFHANGSAGETSASSTFSSMGLKYRLVEGNDFITQVKNYMTGETPYLRGTFRMLAQASGVLGSSSETQPVILLQETLKHMNPVN